MSPASLSLPFPSGSENEAAVGLVRARVSLVAAGFCPRSLPAGVRDRGGSRSCRNARTQPWASAPTVQVREEKGVRTLAARRSPGVAPHKEPEMRAQAPWGRRLTRKLGNWCWFKTVLNGKPRKSPPAAAASDSCPRPQKSLQILAQCMFTGGKVAGT